LRLVSCERWFGLLASAAAHSPIYPPSREWNHLGTDELVAALTPLVKVSNPDAVLAMSWAIHPDERRVWNANTDLLAVPRATAQPYHVHTRLGSVAGDLSMNLRHVAPTSLMWPNEERSIHRAVRRLKGS